MENTTDQVKVEQPQDKIDSRPPYFYNAHAHVFTLDHVPDKFARGMTFITIRISWLRNNIIYYITKNGHVFLKFLTTVIKVSRVLNFLLMPFGGLARIRGAANFLAHRENLIATLDRMFNLVRHGNRKEQEDVIDNLQSYYPGRTKFILLPMDMENMNGGKPAVPYFKENDESCQIISLEKVKKKTEYKDVIYPFIFAEPKRIATEPAYFDYFKSKIDEGIFSGIKMYPALGYWPFDERLKETYDFAIERNVPFMSHCVRGVVYDRRPEFLPHHPVSENLILKGKKARDYTTHYTNPLNFHFLMDQKLLSRIWGPDAPDYSRLKVCLAHYGGSSEWNHYLDDAWHSDRSDNDMEPDFPSLHEPNWNFDITRETNRFGWYSIITEMIRKYDNVYGDISFTLHDPKIWPLLKMLLETDPKIRRRILFGTDFYVVAQLGTERRLSVDLRSYLGEELFYQIAYYNVEEYLSTTIKAN